MIVSIYIIYTNIVVFQTYMYISTIPYSQKLRWVKTLVKVEYLANKTFADCRLHIATSPPAQKFADKTFAEGGTTMIFIKVPATWYRIQCVYMYIHIHVHVQVYTLHVHAYVHTR